MEIKIIKKEKNESEYLQGIDDVLFTPKIITTISIPIGIYKEIKKEVPLSHWIVERFIEWKTSKSE